MANEADEKGRREENPTCDDDSIGARLGAQSRDELGEWSIIFRTALNDYSFPFGQELRNHVRLACQKWKSVKQLLGWKHSDLYGGFCMAH